MTRKSSGKSGGTSAADQGATGSEKDEEENSVNSLQRENRSARLDAAAEARIGRKLKAMYDQVLNEPVPDHLMDLLGKLDQKTRSDD
jgi:Anti-sigma factor NepR